MKKSAIFQTYSQSGGEPQRDRKQGDSSGDLHQQSAPEGRPRDPGEADFPADSSSLSASAESIAENRVHLPMDNRQLLP